MKIAMGIESKPSCLRGCESQSMLEFIVFTAFLTKATSAHWSCKQTTRALNLMVNCNLAKYLVGAGECQKVFH